jgi:hypothetical protein
MTDKWAEYKEKFCGCKDASRLNSCRGLHNCELPVGNPERKQAQSAEPVQGEAIRVRGYIRCESVEGMGFVETLTHAAGHNAYPLMTVAQHNRLIAAAKPDAELVDLLRQCLDAMRAPYSDTRLMARIDAKLSEANKP